MSESDKGKIDFSPMLFFMLALSFLLAMVAVSAIDKSVSISGAATTEVVSGSLTETSAGTDVAIGGNVTDLDLNADASTTKWQGYFGEVTASLALGVGANDLYNFGSATASQIKGVFASTDASFNFANLTNVSRLIVDTIWNFDSFHVDSANATFTNTENISSLFNVQTVALIAYNNAAFDAARAQNTSIYKSGIFRDGGNEGQFDFDSIAFGVNVNADEFAFDNATTTDYEMIVAVNGTENGDTQTYSFFLDLV